jgi:hypothetical protein
MTAGVVGRVALAAVLACVGVLGTACSAATAPTTTGHPSPRSAAAPRVTPPPVHGRFDYQIGGAYTPGRAVRIVDRDRTEPPAAGTYGICYVNGFQTQDDEAGFWTKEHPDLLVDGADGRPVRDPEWPEYVLDTSTPAKRTALLAIVGPWIDGCARAGYRGLEIDNLDSYLRSEKRLALEDDVAFATALVDRAHRDGLAAGQKNTPDLAETGRRTVGFDFAVAEECQRYDECDGYTKAYGDHVIEIEYTDSSRSTFRAACAARGGRISVVLRDRDVVPPSDPAYRSEWC